MNIKTRFHLFIIVLTAASLACSINVGGPEYPAETIPASPDAALSMQDMIQQAIVTGAETGVITLQITESQLTSFIAQKLSQQADPPFTDPQIFLRDGQMKLYGKITQGWFTANMLIVMNVVLDPVTGQPAIQIASADFGPFPAPEGLNTAISAVIDEAFTGSFGPVASGFRMESIAIANGVMTVTGRIK
jgi:hypothetical protein